MTTANDKTPPIKGSPEEAAEALKKAKPRPKVTQKDIDDNPERKDLVKGQPWPEDVIAGPAPVLVTQADIDANPSREDLVLNQPWPTPPAQKAKRIATQAIIDANPDKGYTLNQEIPDEDVINEPAALSEPSDNEWMHAGFVNADIETAANMPAIVAKCRQIVMRADDIAGDVSFPHENMTSEDIERVASNMAGDGQALATAIAIIERAKAIHAEANKPAPKTVEEMAAENYERLVGIYGKDFVTAKKGNNQTYFSRLTWNQMGKNKQGWAEVTKEMPEVADSKKKK